VEIEMFVTGKIQLFKGNEVPFTIIHLERLPLKFYVHSGVIIPHRASERERERYTHTQSTVGKKNKKEFSMRNSKHRSPF
jgi:hypothetical protein